MRRTGALFALVSAGLMTEAARGVEERKEEGDVVGIWDVDGEVFRSDFERAVESEYAGLPEVLRVHMQSEAELKIGQMLGSGGAYAEFRPGGQVIFHSPGDAPSAGSWSLDGERIRFERAARLEGEPGYDGTVEEGVMRVEPDPDLPLTVPLTLRRR
jgi:hypothetical protein